MLTIVVLGVVCALVASLCQTATGFGFALVFVPLLSLGWGVKAAVATSVVLGPVAAAPAVVELWRVTRWRVVAVLLAGSFVGAPAGAVLLAVASATTLRVIVAVLIVTSTAAVLRLPVRDRQERVPAMLGVGVVSGVLRSSTSIGGPPVAIYLFGLRYPPGAFVGTNGAYYLLGSFVSIAVLIGARQAGAATFTVALAAAPAVLCGGMLGRALRARASEATFRTAVILLLLVTSAAVLAPVLLRGR